LFQIIVSDFIEMLRLSLGSGAFLHPLSPLFSLIIVDRDDDAYSLVKEWGNPEPEPHTSLKETYKGDWIHMTGQDKTENFYNCVPQKRDPMGSAYKLALLAIKMKIIYTMKDKTKGDCVFCRFR
jgi:hypothetical protein